MSVSVFRFRFGAGQALSHLAPYIATAHRRFGVYLPPPPASRRFAPLGTLPRRGGYVDVEGAAPPGVGSPPTRPCAAAPPAAGGRTGARGARRYGAARCGCRQRAAAQKASQGLSHARPPPRAGGLLTSRGATRPSALHTRPPEGGCRAEGEAGAGAKRPSALHTLPPREGAERSEAGAGAKRPSALHTLPPEGGCRAIARRAGAVSAARSASEPLRCRRG